jgi:O-antigen/teichoic acid export membrane protein
LGKAVSHIAIALASYAAKLLLPFDMAQEKLLCKIKCASSEGQNRKLGSHWELQVPMRGMTLGGGATWRAIHTARVLLQNTRSILKKILQNLASVLGGEAMVRAANFTAAIAIARHYGPAILGLYGACLAVVTIVFMFAESGLQLSAITEIGAVRGQAAWVVGQLYLSKVILCAFAVVVLFAVGAYGGFPRIYWVIGGLVTLRTLLQSCSQLQIAILKSLFRMHLIGIIQAFHAGVLFLGIGIAFVHHWSMVTLLEILVAGQTLELLFMSGAVYSARIHPRWPVFSKCFALMRRSVPLGLGYALANLIVRADVVVLSLLVPLPEIGQFSAADNLLSRT